MARSTVHYADSDTNNTLKKLHNKLRPAGTPVQRVEYIIELLLLRIFEVKLKQDQEFRQLRDLFKEPNDDLLFSSLYTVSNKQLLPTINEKFFPFYAGILPHARKVYKKTNLSQKVLDQLVLIGEVFKNSNFTNNVKSGNLQEIISLVSEINEERLLKTDLLGDAIESALSETGGTKDLGLHRTPDHVRQFMVGVAAPSFSDSIYDPACGTGGFLFDSWGYVTEAIRRDGLWPGPKAHPEIAAYYKNYFTGKDAPMPSAEQAISFYRSGISGTEYLGVIRKMAAINLYIRGLNPSNIVQGDSLALFNAAEHGNSKTTILANPPFGAERDQEAYSNIWEEYPREAETTLLFVKLMLDSLASGGICAVVVSEGFLTWDQTSARALRKMLLDESRLKAVISLPQGVFVSKGGVGPKTSILVFEKGGKIDQLEFDSKLAQHEEIWRSKTLNEIAKRIEKAHLYSFNLGNYRSNLSKQQIDEWNSFFTGDKNHSDLLSLDEKFDRLQVCSPDNAHDTLAYFDIQNGLEFDIVRQYLGRFSVEELKQNNHLAELQKIIESSAKYPRVRLGEYLIKNTGKIKPQNFPETRFRVLGVSNTDGIFFNETKYGREIKQAYFKVKPKEFCYNPYRVNVGSIGLNEFDYDNQIISGAYNIFGTDETELHPEYLMALFKSPQFLAYVNDKAHGGVRMNFKYKYLEDWEIPLPPQDKQGDIIRKIQSLSSFVAQSQMVSTAWRPQLPDSVEKKLLGDFIIDSLYGISTKLQDEGAIPVIRMNNLDDRGFWNLDDMKYNDNDLPESRFLQKGDFLFNRTNSIDLVGKSTVADFDSKISWAGYLIRLRLTPELDPNYLKYLFASPKYRKMFRRIAKPAGGQANINADELSAVKIDYRPLEEQEDIVAQLDNEVNTIKSLLEISKRRAKDIKSAVNSIWNE